MGSLIARLGWLRREVLGLNRRNQDLLLRLNPARFVALVDHKVETKTVLSQHGLPVPDTFGHYTRQRELPAFADEVGRHTEFVLKPARGAGGEGIVVVAGRRADRLLRPSGASLGLGDLLAHAADIIAGAFSLGQPRDEALLEHRLRPDAVLGAFSPGGIPDIRIVLFRGVPIMAMLRLPTRRSGGRANLHVGGVGVGVDLTTGRAVHAIWRDRSIATHPDTGQSLAQIVVPRWEDILLLAARTYDAIPLGFVGVDIVIDAELGPVILELNARPGLAIQLANRRGLRRPLSALAERALAGMSAPDRVAVGQEIGRRPGAATEFERIRS